jgi:hypothetical protein
MWLLVIKPGHHFYYYTMCETYAHTKTRDKPELYCDNW